MIVNGDRENLLRPCLTDDMLVERPHDVCGFGDLNRGLLLTRLVVKLLVEDAFANSNATVANIDAGAGNKFPHLRVAFATEGAHRQIASPGHL